MPLPQNSRGVLGDSIEDYTGVKVQGLSGHLRGY